MIRNMRQPSRRRHLFTALLTMCIAIGAAGVSTARAAAEPEDVPPNDARVEGYQLADKIGPQAITDQKGASTAWVILILLGVLCVGVTFKNGKRSHLD